MVAVAVDLSQLYEARVRLQNAAEQASAAGASQGQLRRRRERAGLPPPLLRVCLQKRGRRFQWNGGSTTCTNPEGTDEVIATVTIQAPVAMPLPILGGTFTITATFTAAPVVGGLIPVG